MCRRHGRWGTPRALVSPDLGSAFFHQTKHAASSTMSNQTNLLTHSQPDSTRRGGIADACSPSWCASLRAHNCPTVIDVALIQPCDVVSFGSGPQCAWTLDDIPGFLIAFPCPRSSDSKIRSPSSGSFPAGYHPFAHEPLPAPGQGCYAHTLGDSLLWTRATKKLGRKRQSARPTRGGLLPPNNRPAHVKCWNYLHSRLAPKSSRPMEERRIIGR
jgi:hypothetical protein